DDDSGDGFGVPAAQTDTACESFRAAECSDPASMEPHAGHHHFRVRVSRADQPVQESAVRRTGCVERRRYNTRRRRWLVFRRQRMALVWLGRRLRVSTRERGLATGGKTRAARGAWI